MRGALRVFRRLAVLVDGDLVLRLLTIPTGQVMGLAESRVAWLAMLSPAVDRCSSHGSHRHTLVGTGVSCPVGLTP